MGLSAILKKVVHTKSASQSSSNGDTGGGRKSLDSSSGSRTTHPAPRKSLDTRQDRTDATAIRTPLQPSSFAAQGEPSSPARQPVAAAAFDPPRHAAPAPPPKDATAPQLRTPEFKPFSVSADSPNSKTATKSSVPAGSRHSPPSEVTFEGHPFPSETRPPPTEIRPPPTSRLPNQPVPTQATGAINPSYLSHTESIYAPTPYTPEQHLAYHVARLPPVTSVPTRSQILPSAVSHHQQRLELADKIQRDHHPKKTPLSPAGVELFAKAGMEVHDPEGKGTIDWTEHWLPAVVQEHITPHEHREYKTVIHREIHRYHIYPMIQPIVDTTPPSPSEELHYFRDSQGQWREIRGRAVADEILRACGATHTDETMSWVDTSAVVRERDELVGLVRNKDQADRTESTRRELERLGLGDRNEVRDAERRGVVGVGKGQMVGDTNENDGQTKAVRGIAL